LFGKTFFHDFFFIYTCHKWFTTQQTCFNKHERSNRNCSNRFIFKLTDKFYNFFIFYCFPNIHSSWQD